MRSRDTNQYLHTDSGSVFGQATWHVTDRWSLTGGVREILEDKSTRVQRDAPVGGVQPGDRCRARRVRFRCSRDERYVDCGALERRISSERAIGSGMPRHPREPSRAASIRRCRIQVSPCARCSSNLSSALDYEFGFKSSLFDRRLQLNANLFWTDVEDYQATQLEFSPQTSTFTQILSNIGKVRTRGVETEITAAPVAGPDARSRSVIQ